MIQSEEWCLHYQQRDMYTPQYDLQDILEFGTLPKVIAQFWEIAQQRDIVLVEVFNPYEAEPIFTFTAHTEVDQHSSVPGLFARTHTYRTLQEVSSDEGEK